MGLCLHYEANSANVFPSRQMGRQWAHCHGGLYTPLPDDGGKGFWRGSVGASGSCGLSP